MRWSPEYAREGRGGGVSAASYGIGDDIAETVAFDSAGGALAVFAFDFLVP